jgi:hypothetical protein
MVTKEDMERLLTEELVEEYIVKNRRVRTGLRNILLRTGRWGLGWGIYYWEPAGEDWAEEYIVENRRVRTGLRIILLRTGGWGLGW